MRSWKSWTCSFGRPSLTVPILTAANCWLPNRATKMASVKYGKGAVGLLKQMWGEIPEVVAASAYTVVGIVAGVIAAHSAEKNQASRKKYRYQYTVYRDDDPVLPDLRKYGPVN